MTTAMNMKTFKGVLGHHLFLHLNNVHVLECFSQTDLHVRVSFMMPNTIEFPPLISNLNLCELPSTFDHVSPRSTSLEIRSFETKLIIAFIAVDS